MAAMPDDLADEDAGGAAVRKRHDLQGAEDQEPRGGDRVAVVGIGRPGHLAVQFAVRLGFETAAVARPDKEALARRLGARTIIDSPGGDPAAELQALGGREHSG